MAEIIYTYKDSVYANITNQCNCRCIFCIRFLTEGIGDADTLWHKVNPTKTEVIEAIKAFDFSAFEELVFCGYGEPTCALDTLLAAAQYAKKEKHLRVRLNTNGLGSAENGRDIVPDLAEVFDSISISLNAPTHEKYDEIVRPQIPGAFQKMCDFAERCREMISDVRLTIVDVLPEDEIENCQELSEKLEVPLRIRHYS